LGWNNDGTKRYTSAQGNNVISTIGTFNADGGEALNFVSAFNAAEQPTTDNNKKASIINNFYVSNMVHDITYQYGFDEASGNFQTTNFDKVQNLNRIF